jgi:hypothetical protein
VIDVSGVLEPGVRIQQADHSGQNRDQERDRPEQARRERTSFIVRRDDL